MRQNLLGIILLVVILISVTALGLIYWFKYRPADVRALCWQEQLVNARPRPPWDQNKKRVRTFQECLQDHGVSE